MLGFRTVAALAGVALTIGVDGRYYGADDEIHTLSTGHKAQYATSSVLDAYRAQVQLLAMLDGRRLRAEPPSATVSRQTDHQGMAAGPAVTKGGKVSYTLGTTPSRTWGSGPEDVPPQN